MVKLYIFKFSHFTDVSEGVDESSYINPLHPNIQMHILLSVLYTYTKELTGEFV